MLPDTLGILNPDETFAFCRQMKDSYPDKEFDFHAHNDYDLATGNIFMAIKAGITCITCHYQRPGRKGRQCAPVECHGRG